jgi:alpha-tubulin suppressor-like RCC1 family protein
MPSVCYAWGYNDEGQLGDGTTTESHVPVTMTQLAGFNPIALDSGMYHCLALKPDGTVWSWGYNYYALGDEAETTSSATPIQVATISSITAISAGQEYSLARKSDGTVWGWGRNQWGQLGPGAPLAHAPTPIQIDISGVQSIAAAYRWCLALKTDGTVWAWGSNAQGLGDGSTTTSSAPVQVDITDVTAVAVGGFHGVALKSDGTVWCWGLGTGGQLGDDTLVSKPAPVQASGLTSVVAIAAGYHQSFALKSDGTVWSWGLNQQGTLGLGDIDTRQVPTQIPDFSGVSAITCENYHVIARKTDGTVWTWGLNSYGQVGNNSTENALSPAQVSGLSGVTMVAVGQYVSMALVPNVGDGLYYSPGRKSTAPYAAELYVYDGVNTPSLVWTGPPYVAYEARWVLCHLYNYNGKILIFMFNTSGDVEARRVYEFDPVTRNTVLRVNDYEPEVGGDTWTGVFSVAEHNGKLLISHAGNANDVILSRLDPSDWSITFIQKVESVDDGVGGIVVHDDGYIYWNTGQFILSSTTGEPGSFTEIYDMNGPWNTWAVSNDLQPHTDGYVYCGGIYTEASGHNRQRIYKIRDNTVTVDHDEDHLSFEEQCIQVAFESTPEGLFAIPWFGEIYVKNGGTWQSDGTVTNWSNTPHSAYFKGKVYWGGDNEPRQLRRRDAPGSVSVVATHDNWAVPIYEESMPMVVAPYYPLATRRPRVQFIRIGK